MILSGVFNKNSSAFSREIKEVSRRCVEEDLFFLENDLITVLAGKTSSTVEQGCVLTNGKTILIGKAFKKTDFQPLKPEDLPEEEEKEFFTRHFWGNYILITLNNDFNSICVTRDPTGQFPFFYTKLSSGEVLFSSHLDVLFGMLEEKPSFNWRYFSKYLIKSSFIAEETVFENIYELPFGCHLSSAQHKTYVSVAWNPLDYCQGYRTSQGFQSAIIDTLMKVTEAWTRKTKIAILDYSGGTDSTGLLFILNSVLRESQLLKPVNFFHPAISSSDEREFAFATARELGVEIESFDRSNSPPFDQPLCPLNFRPNWPTATLMHLRARECMDSLAKDYTNVTFVSGRGGDQAFMYSIPTESLCDYFIEKGGRGLTQLLKELYAMSRKPLPRLLNEMLMGLFRYKFYSSFQQFSFASKGGKKVPWFEKEMYEMEELVDDHPFFCRHKHGKMLPGKLKHIISIYRGLGAIKGDVRENHTNPVFYPLYSQPVVELALSMPTYESFAKGYNRFQFREAISRRFNTRSVWRKDKGQVSGIIQSALDKNLKGIMELCLEGEVGKAGLINRNLLHKSIRGMAHGELDYLWPIMNLICLEMFINHWK